MSEIKHYILTRFNVATPGRWEEIRLRPHWLEKRFELFRDFCLPGVASQTRKDFEWIIFFDAETPADYMARIEALRSQFPFRIIKTKLFEMRDMCQQLMAEQDNADWLLTTRLDSDDILAKDFVERLRAQLNPETRHNFNFPNGLILSLSETGNKLYADRDESGPFASYLEPYSDDIKTIWEKQHRFIDELAPIHQGDAAPAWLQVVHGDNISNHVRGKRVAIQDYTERFCYLNTLPPENMADVMLENYTLTPLRAFKENLRNSVKKLLGRR